MEYTCILMFCCLYAFSACIDCVAIIILGPFVLHFIFGCFLSIWITLSKSMFAIVYMHGTSVHNTIVSHTLSPTQHHVFAAWNVLLMRHTIACNSIFKNYCHYYSFSDFTLRNRLPQNQTKQHTVTHTCRIK